jgi:hypothetical protein
MPDRYEQLTNATSDLSAVERVLFRLMLHQLEEEPYDEGSLAPAIRTVSKLLPLADVAWRDSDPDGYLVFLDIYAAHPKVTYCREGVKAELMRRVPGSYIMRLRDLSEIMMLSASPLIQ